MGRLFFLLVLAAAAYGAWEYSIRYGVPAEVAPYVPEAMATRIDQARDARAGSGNERLADSAGASRNAAGEPATPSSGGLPENADLRINKAGLAIIKEAEGLRLEAYTLGGKEYIGYGHQLKPGEPRKIDLAQADAFLRADLASKESGVRRRLTRAANVNEFSAMVSLAYNLGVGGFSRSPVLSKFNAGDKQGAADAFLNHNRAGGQVLDKLTRRREKERALFLTPA